MKNCSLFLAFALSFSCILNGKIVRNPENYLGTNIVHHCDKDGQCYQAPNTIVNVYIAPHDMQGDVRAQTTMSHKERMAWALTITLSIVIANKMLKEHRVSWYELFIKTWIGSHISGYSDYAWDLGKLGLLYALQPETQKAILRSLGLSK